MNISCARARRTSSAAIFFAVVLFFSTTFAQTSPTGGPTQPKATPTRSLEKKFLINILRDQRAIWTLPFHLHRSDAKWIAPLGLSTAALMTTDRRTSLELVENGDNLTRLRISKDISQLGSFYATGALAAVFYFTGRANNNARAKETGVLSAEALIDSLIAVGALKLVSERPRPSIDNSSGEFFEGGRSFPSGHAISAWSFATVIDQEYGQHRPLVRFGVYSLATAVSLSRYTARKHFLSDVLVGSAIGYGIGRYVYSQHHDPGLDSIKGKQTNGVTTSSLFPRIAPLYYPHSHVYGAALAWSF